MGKLASPFLQQDQQQLTRRRSSVAAEELHGQSERLRRECAVTLDIYRLAVEIDDGQLLPLMPPPFHDMVGSKALPIGTSVPFLCFADGSLPAGMPSKTTDLEPYLFGAYGSGKEPEYYVDGVVGELTTEDEVRHALSRCTEEHSPYWITCEVPQIAHPSWFPRQPERSVPSYNTLIAGVGASGIGMHQDGYKDRESGCHRLVSTYLTIGVGRKHVVMLPPSAEGEALAKQLSSSSDEDGQEGEAVGTSSRRVPEFPIRPPPDTLDAVVGCGGFWFDVDVATEEGGRPLTIFIPVGWWHWLAGAADCEWHIAWGGSFLPSWNG